MRKATGSYRAYSIPDKTAAVVPEFAVEDLPSAELQPWCLEKFKYLGLTVTNTNDIREEIKRRVNMGNACYYSHEKILSSRLLSNKLK